MKKIKYQSGDIQYFNDKGQLIKTELNDLIIDHRTTPKTVTLKR